MGVTDLGGVRSWRAVRDVRAAGCGGGGGSVLCVGSYVELLDDADVCSLLRLYEYCCCVESLFCHLLYACQEFESYHHVSHDDDSG